MNRAFVLTDAASLAAAFRSRGHTCDWPGPNGRRPLEININRPTTMQRAAAVNSAGQQRSMSDDAAFEPLFGDKFTRRQRPATTTFRG